MNILTLEQIKAQCRIDPEMTEEMERARRRYLELQERGISADINEIENDIIERDKRDMNREFAPLKQAADAIFVDSSDMTIDEVADTIIKHFEQLN